MNALFYFRNPLKLVVPYSKKTSAQYYLHSKQYKTPELHRIQYSNTNPLIYFQKCITPEATSVY